MGIEAGDIQTGAPTYRNFKETIFKLLDVTFGQVTAILMLQKLQLNLNHLNEIFQKLCHHWPKQVIGLLTKTTFNLQKWEFCNGTDIQPNRQTNINRKLDCWLNFFFKSCIS